jgi:hypothetical protein
MFHAAAGITHASKLPRFATSTHQLAFTLLSFVANLAAATFSSVRGGEPFAPAVQCFTLPIPTAGPKQFCGQTAAGGGTWRSRTPAVERKLLESADPRL